MLLRVRAGEKLLIEKRVSESLLLNILPGEVADELRAKGLVSPKYFEDVTILFTDFVGFTLSTEKLAAEELVELLHDYFTAFDQIVARYRLEKMKTIGDSYMCISGLPMRNPAHPVDMVMAAFEMLEAVRQRQRPDRLAQWKVRIGIHTGPVIAGVVGINKFAFDIWGDTVNYSSRMESSGEANRINLSERTYSRVKDFFAVRTSRQSTDQGKARAGHVLCERHPAQFVERIGSGAAARIRAPIQRLFPERPSVVPGIPAGARSGACRFNELVLALGFVAHALLPVQFTPSPIRALCARLWLSAEKISAITPPTEFFLPYFPPITHLPLLQRRRNL